MSAEVSERSKLAVLEHGIEESTTATDRTWAHGAPGQQGAPPPAAVSSASIAAWEATVGEQRPGAEPEPADSAPRLTVRVYGTAAAIVDPTAPKPAK